MHGKKMKVPTPASGSDNETHATPTDRSYHPLAASCRSCEDQRMEKKNPTRRRTREPRVARLAQAIGFGMKSSRTKGQRPRSAYLLLTGITLRKRHDPFIWGKQEFWLSHGKSPTRARWSLWTVSSSFWMLHSGNAQRRANCAFTHCECGGLGDSR